MLRLESTRASDVFWCVAVNCTVIFFPVSNNYIYATLNDGDTF